MSDQWIGRLVFMGFLAVVFLLAIAFTRLTPLRRARSGDTWARRHLAYVPSEWTKSVDRQLETNLRLDIAAIFLMGVAATFPRGEIAWAACLASVPALFVVTRGLRLGREPLVPGPRVARVREVSLSDYVPNKTRWMMWGATALSCIVVVIAALRYSSPVLTMPALVLVLGSVAIESAGARLARRPEPATDLCHLYWQDCLRVDAVRKAAALSLGSAWLLLMLLPFLPVSPMDLPGYWSVAYLTPFSYAMAVAGSKVREHDHPVDHMRSRLWPSLAPGQVLMPGDTLPREKAAA
jgi:hypothetical protein